VHDLAQSIRFYKALFDAEPTVKKDDYAKWQLEDPRVNFAISMRGAKAGLDHLGIQVDEDAELGQLRSQLAQACAPPGARPGVVWSPPEPSSIASKFQVILISRKKSPKSFGMI
jgi:hypothetical protein